MKSPFGELVMAKSPCGTRRELGGGLSIRLPVGGNSAVLGTRPAPPSPDPSGAATAPK